MESSKNKIFNKFKAIKANLTVFFFEALYRSHIRIRYLHDKVYQRGGTYKRYTDSPVSSYVHRASVLAFVFSFIVFQFMQNIWPYMFTMKPREVTASQSTVSWTSYNDFNDNNGATGTTTQSQATINDSGTPNDAEAGNVQLKKTLDLGSGTSSLTVNYATGTTSEYTVSGTTASLIAASTTATPSSSGQKTLNVASSTDFSVGQKVFIVQTKGTGLGNQEKATIASKGAGILTMVDNLQNSYTNASGSEAKVVLIKEYTDVTITNNTTFNSSANILVFKASGTVQVDTGSSINMTGKGYAAGQGPGAGGAGSTSCSSGNGSAYSGGGGGYGTAGVGGTGGYGDIGTPGPVYGAYPILPLVGSGGGNSGPCEETAGGAGGAGGGLVKIDANAFTLNGSGNIVSNGNNGTSNAAGGGGGSGGGIYLLSNTAVSGAGNVSATGGSGAWYLGGNGGSGRIVIQAPSAPSGTPSGVYVYESPTYFSPGTLGGTTDTNIGLRFDADPGGTTGKKAKAAALTWNATTGVAGQKVLFKVRSGDTQAELDSSACYGPSTSEANPCSDWTTAGKFFSQINGASNSSTTVLDTIASKRYIEVLVRLESSGADTPTLSDITLTYDNVEAPELASTSISTASNGTISTGGTEGTYTKDTTVNITTTGLTCTSCGTSTQRQVEVEVKPVATAFDGTATGGFLVQGDYNDTTFASTATISGLSAGTSYHSRLRTIDAQGRVSGWTSYGGGTDTPTAAADFSIEQTPPTGTVSVENGAQYATSNLVTLNLSASDTGGSGMGTTEGMRFSNDDLSWSNWEAYATTKANWDLTNATYGGTLGDGPNKTVYAQFKDNAGNVNEGSITDSINLDTTAPDMGTITAKTDSAGSLITPSAWQTDNDPYFEWSAPSDASGIAGYYYALDDNTPEDGGTWTTSLNVQLANDSVSDGQRTFYVRAEDEAGNKSGTLGSFVIYIDTDNPAVTDSQIGDDTWRNTNNGTYNVDFSDGGSGLSYFQTKVTTEAAQGGTLRQDWTTVVSDINAASYDTNWALQTSTWDALQEGTNYVSVRVYDNLGQTVSQNDVFYVNKDTEAPSPPTLSCTVYPHNTSSNSSEETTCSINDTAGPSARTATAYSTNNGTNWTNNGGNLGFSFTPQEGTTNVKMRISDSGGGPTNSNTYIIKVDRTAPTVIRVQSNTEAGVYGMGETIDVRVVFDEAVNVTGEPQITLETGANDRTANYVSGSGSDTLVFNYTVSDSDVSADLNYASTSALSLNLGTIEDLVENDASLALPDLTSEDSLAGQEAIVIDTAVPESSLSVTPSADGENGWYKTNPSITINVADPGVGGILRTEYQWNSTSGSWTTYSSAINVPSDGIHTLYYRSIGNSGNTESAKSQEFKLDRSAGETTLTPSPSIPDGSNGWYKTALTLSLSASDATSGVGSIKYQWDSQAGDWLAYSQALSVSQGTHTIYYKAIDNAGNEETVKSQEFKLDTSAPVWSGETNITRTGGSQTSINLGFTGQSDNIAIDKFVIEKQLVTFSTLSAPGSWDGAISITIEDGNASSYEDTGLSTGTSYWYRIKAIDNAGNETWANNIPRLATVDTLSPTNPSSVTATATTEGANRGYEIRLSWTESADVGSGVKKYKIFRRNTTNSAVPTDANGYSLEDPSEKLWDLVGTLHASGPVVTEWYDNDANNDALDFDSDPSNGNDKSEASQRLNDYVDYYYRIVAIDEQDNATEIVTTESGQGIIVTEDNYAFTKTADATPPQVPQDLAGEAIAYNRIDLSWTATSDPNNASRIPNKNGSDVSEYKVYRKRTASLDKQLDGDFVEITSNIQRESATSTTVIDDYDFSANGAETYQYKIYALDGQGNPQNPADLFTEDIAVNTPNNSTPTTPVDVTVTTEIGDQGSNSEIGHKNTVAFEGSSLSTGNSGNAFRVKSYKLYRSTLSPQGVASTDWLSDQSTKEIATVNLTGTLSYDETNATYIYQDNDISNNDSVSSQTKSYLQREGSGGSQSYTLTKSQTPVLDDATTYYYRVRAYSADAIPLPSNLSGVVVGTLHAGWDTTADDTAPATPSDLKIQAIWGANTGDIRIVITWQKIETPTRNGNSDFKEYRVYKSTDNIVFNQLLVNESNPLYNSDKEAALENNYYVDSDVLAANAHYYYKVSAIDDAGTEFKYTVSPFSLINAYSNESEKSSTVDLNPSQVVPQISTLPNGKKAEVRSVGVSSATIYWETNQNTESVVSFRKSGTSDLFVTTGTEGMSTTHTVDLRALEAGTAYDYRISGKNIIGNDKKVGYGQNDEGIGSDTSGNDDVPVLTTSSFLITDISVISTTTTSAITWNTNIDSDSNVEYKKEAKSGEAAEESKTAGDPKLTKNHEVVIKALRPDTNYTYKVRSVTLDKYISETAFLTFKTKPYDSSQFTITPNASSIAEQNITATSAKIVWNTAVATTSWLDYGTSAGSYNQSAGDNKYNTVHVVELLNLTPGTTYFYKVRGKDSNDIEYTSQEYSFTAVLLPEVLNPKTSDLTSYTITIGWETNVSATSFVAYGKDTAYGSGVGKTEPSKAHSTKLENLEDNTTYHYQISVKDQFGNEAKSADLTFTTPIDNAGPEVREVKIDILPMGTDDETASAIISWTTNKPATTQVDYDEGVLGGKYSMHSIEDKNLNGAHTVIIKELNPSTTYHFKIVSRDKRGNKTDSQDYTFVTPTKEKSILQLIIRSLEETFSWVRDMPRFFKGLRGKITGR